MNWNGLTMLVCLIVLAVAALCMLCLGDWLAAAVWSGLLLAVAVMEKAFGEMERDMDEHQAAMHELRMRRLVK